MKITIEKEVRINQKDQEIILEKGDKIEILKENFSDPQDYQDLAQFIEHSFNGLYDLAWKSFYDYASHIDTSILRGWMQAKAQGIIR